MYKTKYPPVQREIKSKTPRQINFHLEKTLETYDMVDWMEEYPKKPCFNEVKKITDMTQLIAHVHGNQRVRCMYFKGEHFPSMEMFIEVMKIIKGLRHHIICSYGFIYDFEVEEITLSPHKFHYYMTESEIKPFLNKED